MRYAQINNSSQKTNERDVDETKSRAVDAHLDDTSIRPVVRRVPSGRFARIEAVSAALLAAHTPSEVAELIVDVGLSAFGASAGVLLYLEGDDLILGAARGLAFEDIERWKQVCRNGPSPCMQAFLTHTPIFIETGAECATWFLDDRHNLFGALGARMALPLIVQEKAIGVIAFGFANDVALGEKTRALATTLARQCALALDRARLYAAHEQKSRMLEALIQACPVAISLFNRNGVVCLWNPAAERIFGYRAEEVLGSPLPAFIGTHSSTGVDLATITSGAALDGVEIECLHKSGKNIDISLHAAPIKQADGTTQYLALATDISERKRAEADLRYACDVARDADRRKDEFLALLSHELRNPLSPILTALHLMRMKGEARTERERQVVERQVKHLVSLVDDLLDVSRITRGKIELRIESMSLQRVLQRAIEMASPLFEQRRHELSLDMPAQAIIADVDETRMAQVLANVLTNAAKYTDPGGRVEVCLRNEKHDAIITVRDNGVGIRPELLPNIFDLFVQDEQGSDRAGGGLGLGLALVRSLVTLHGGRVTARSDGPGKGTEFKIMLPLPADPQGKTSPTPPPLTPRSERSRHILLVDDNVDSIEMIALVLENEGHHVLVAHDGPHALALTQTFRPDIAILDIGLPVMDGYELAAELRKKFGNSIVLIAVTGYGQDHDVRRAYRAGFTKHYVKPVDMTTLLQFISSQQCKSTSA